MTNLTSEYINFKNDIIFSYDHTREMLDRMSDQRRNCLLIYGNRYIGGRVLALLESYNISIGVYSEKNILSFWSGDERSSGMSRVHAEKKFGEPVKIVTDTIDNVIGDDPVTFINMDKEGAELEAMKGAYQTIERNYPKLAIFVYHIRDDLIRIPNFIKEINCEYKLFFRHYVPWSEELTLYAVLSQ